MLCVPLGVPNTHQPAPLTFQEFAWLTRVRELREQVGEPETLLFLLLDLKIEYPPGELTYPTKLEKEHHFPIILWMGYVSSQEGMVFSTVTDRSDRML